MQSSQGVMSRKIAPGYKKPFVFGRNTTWKSFRVFTRMVTHPRIAKCFYSQTISIISGESSRDVPHLRILDRTSNHSVRLMLFDLAPGFRPYWESESNLFVESDGSYTAHGIFSGFSHFVRDHLLESEELSRTKLFNIIEKLVNTNPNSSSGVSNAVCTCFLENLAGEGKFSDTIGTYLGPEARKYFDEWDN